MFRNWKCPDRNAKNNRKPWQRDLLWLFWLKHMQLQLLHTYGILNTIIFYPGGYQSYMSNDIGFVM